MVGKKLRKGVERLREAFGNGRKIKKKIKNVLFKLFEFFFCLHTLRLLA